METNEVISCIKCGGNNIKFYNYGYTSFNIGKAKCECGHEIIVSNIDSNAPNNVLIPFWNNANDPVVIREKLQKEIDEKQKEIDNLPKPKIKKLPLTITVSGQSCVGKSRILYCIKKMLQNLDFDVKHTPVDFEDDEMFDVKMAWFIDNAIKSLKDKTEITLVEVNTAPEILKNN